ncbi:MAG: imidazole glycerol phosphate synthase subunit HisH [Spirochaetota bacterium]|nr:imidazole glycerol phosphate synthase subunit HisH [Spirochaetota bacterium]
MIHIIDYGRGNLNNVRKAFLSFGYEAKIIENPNEIDNSQGLVLPGVGAFGDSMNCLNDQGFSDKIREYINLGKPFLGICLGLQLLFEESDEFGYKKGLAVIKGHVTRFKIKDKVPHIGWNQAEFKKTSCIFTGIPNESYFYFVHSYYAIPEDNSIILATTHYGVDFTSAVEHKNIYATQFHPEKSQTLGLRIIKNFGDICVNYSSS